MHTAQGRGQAETSGANLGSRDLTFRPGQVVAGNYSFNVPAGTYRVREVVNAGYRMTAPAGGSYLVTLTNGQTTSGKIFGNQ